MKRNLALALVAVLLAFACGTLGAEDHVNLKEAVQAYPVLKGMNKKLQAVIDSLPKDGVMIQRGEAGAEEVAATRKKKTGRKSSKSTVPKR